MGVKWVTSCPVNIFWMAKLIILNTTHRDLGLGDTTLLLNVFFMFFNCWLYFYFYQLSFFFVFLFFGSRWTETYISNIFLWFLYTTYTNKFEDQKSIWAHNLPFIFFQSEPFFASKKKVSHFQTTHYFLHTLQVSKLFARYFKVWIVNRIKMWLFCLAHPLWQTFWMKQSILHKMGTRFVF
jgi:hypothetical protein